MSTSTERMLNLLLSQFEDKPAIKAILEIVGEEFDFHTKLKEQIHTEIWPHTAVGAQLDICGEVVDIGRTVEMVISKNFFGFPGHGNNTFGEAPFYRYGDVYLSSYSMQDSLYRRAIYAKIAKNTSDGSRKHSIASIKRAFDVEHIVAMNAGNAKARIGLPRKATDDELTLIDTLSLVVRGAGIGFDYFYRYSDANTFGFTRGGVNVGNFKGFGVGIFARVLEME